jgi:DtxR family Mn-dependent transcriptional regulator
MKTSTSEENYIKAIYALSMAGENASTTTIAQQLNTKASSVTDMIRKLAEKGLVNYIKYKGVSLTHKGNQSALKTIRKHRLWEVFLVEKLGFGWDEVHEVAEQLEHIESDKLTSRLSSFLGNPNFDPHGDPIPSQAGELPATDLKPLSNCKKGEQLVLNRVKDGNPEFLQYLESISLRLGDQFTVNQIHSFDNTVEITKPDNTALSLSETVSNHLFVSSI